MERAGTVIVHHGLRRYCGADMLLSHAGEGMVKCMLACGQFAAVPAEPRRNLELVREQARQAAGRGASIVVFPELCLTGYLPAAEVRGLAIPADGPEIAKVAESARAAAVAIALGFAERATDGALYDSVALFDATGRLAALYRKTHLFGAEAEWARPGAEIAVFDACGLRLGMWICYDSRFPELPRLLALGGATLCLVAAAWIGPAEEWELAIRARAMDNGIYVAASALQGTTAGRALNGASLVVDPRGTILVRGRQGRDEVVTAEYDNAIIERCRARLPLLADRRADLFARLATGHEGSSGRTAHPGVRRPA